MAFLFFDEKSPRPFGEGAGILGIKSRIFLLFLLRSFYVLSPYLKRFFELVGELQTIML
jgi:hypothetical protein